MRLEPIGCREEKVERRDIGALESDGTARPKCADGARDMCDRELLATMERDFESICPRGTADVAVAEVDAEQVAVRTALLDVVVTGRPNQ